MSTRNLIAALSLAACMPSLAAAQQPVVPNRIGSWEFTISGGMLAIDPALRDFLGSGAPESRFANTASPSRGMPEGEFRVGYNFTKHFGVSISGEAAGSNGVMYLSPTEAITYTWNVNGTTSPYLLLGTELTRIDGQNSRVTHSTWGADAGIGVRHMLSDYVALRLEAILKADGYKEVPMAASTTYSPKIQIGLSFFTGGHKTRTIVETRVDTVRTVRVDTVSRFRVDTVSVSVPVLPAPAPARARELFTLRAVLFEFNRSDLTRSAKDTLGVAVAYLKNHGDVRVEIQGHTDSKGTDDYNMALGLRRAESVKTFLASQGIDAGRVSTRSFGDSQPVAENAINGKDNPAGRALNRRVVVIEVP